MMTNIQYEQNLVHFIKTLRKDFDYHYNHNAETHMEVGNALGRAMAELLDKKKD